MTDQPASHVITLELDGESFAWLNALRREHFPPALNCLDAHLTLFHTIDDEGCAAILRTLADLHPQPITLVFSGLRNLGRGVAVTIEAPGLVAMRAELGRVLAGSLTRQDQQPFRPHVTIQNKADPLMARALLNDLTGSFSPRTGSGTAVLIWDYLSGPWRLRKRVAF